MGGDVAAFARLVEPPRSFPQRSALLRKGAVRLPDAELLHSAQVAGRFTETETLQGHEAPFGAQPVGALPIKDDVMDGQCSYWLVAEGSRVAPEGFSLSETAGDLGGRQKLSPYRTDTH